MANQLDIIQKLIALATNNPSEAEAAAAALKAVRLIQRHNIRIGELGESRKVPKRPEDDPDFMNVVDEILKNAVNPDEWKPLATYVDTDVDDDFWMKKIKDAWRAIRVERKRLESAIHEYRTRSGRSYDPPEWVK